MLRGFHRTTGTFAAAVTLAALVAMSGGVLRAADPGNYVRVLVPIGLPAEFPAEDAGLWMSELIGHNHGDAYVPVTGSPEGPFSCNPAVPVCKPDAQPHSTFTVSDVSHGVRGAFVYLGRAGRDAVDLYLRVNDTRSPHDSWGVQIPLVYP